MLSDHLQARTIIKAFISLSGVEAELLSEAAPVIVWRLIEAIEKHGERKSNIIVYQAYLLPGIYTHWHYYFEAIPP